MNWLDKIFSFVPTYNYMGFPFAGQKCPRIKAVPAGGDEYYIHAHWAIDESENQLVVHRAPISDKLFSTTWAVSRKEAPAGAVIVSGKPEDLLVLQAFINSASGRFMLDRRLVRGRLRPVSFSGVCVPYFSKHLLPWLLRAVRWARKLEICGYAEKEHARLLDLIISGIVAQALFKNPQRPFDSQGSEQLVKMLWREGLPEVGAELTVFADWCAKHRDVFYDELRFLERTPVFACFAANQSHSEAGTSGGALADFAMSIALLCEKNQP